MLPLRRLLRVQGIYCEKEFSCRNSHRAPGGLGLPVSGTTYTVINQTSGKCLDDTNGSTNNGTVLQQYQCFAGNVNQQWTLINPNRGYFELQNRTSGKCLDDTNGSTANGTPVQQYQCFAGNANQDWAVVSAGNGYVKLVNRTSDKCLDDMNGALQNGTALQINDCVYPISQNQGWHLAQ